MNPQELKNSILQMAIQGKLVEQRPEEGTAEELYRQIQVEKQMLIKAGKIKKEKPLPEISDDEKPFDIPESWKIVYLDDLIVKNIKRGKSPTYTTSGCTLVFAQKCNVKTGGINMALAQYLDESTLHKYPQEEIMCHMDIIVNSTGNGTLGRVGIFRDSDNLNNQKIVPDSHVTVIRVSNFILPIYIYYFLRSRQPYLESMGDGSTNQTELKPYVLRTSVVPLPPLSEQKRIVAKIEELLPYIDRYEQAWSKLEDFNKRFPTDLQKSILQMAIQGKLVEQRPEEGTAEDLYKQILAEKQKLIKAGKIKKEKPLPEIPDDEKPFDIPENWVWVRFGSIIDMLSGFAFKSTDFTRPGKYRLLRGINLGVGNVRWDDIEYIDKLTEQHNNFWINKGDVLLGLDRPWISDGIRVAIFDEEQDALLVQRVLRIRETLAITKDYISLMLRSELFKNAVESQTTGISVPHISPSQVANFAIPLPPLAEQKRIVAKLEELLTSCDRLK